MIRKALNGEIACIITKSVSRFSSNTVDLLQTIRALREKALRYGLKRKILEVQIIVLS